MTISVEGKNYELFPEIWLNVDVARIEDKGLMSYTPGDEPKRKLIIHLHPENSQDPASTITVWCTNTCHPDGTLCKIFMAALGRPPRLKEDMEALLLGRRLKMLNGHRIGAKDGLTYNKAKDFAPADPPLAKSGTKPSAKSRTNGTKAAGKSGYQVPGATEVPPPAVDITDDDVPENLR